MSPRVPMLGPGVKYGFTDLQTDHTGAQAGGDLILQIP